MSLNRDFLTELQLTGDTADRILAAYEEAVAALTRQHDAALAEAQSAHEAYRMQVEMERRQSARRAALSDALSRFGANPQALPLMLDALSLPEEAWDGDALADEGSILNDVRARYAPMFDKPRTLPTSRIAPPDSPGGPLTLDDLRRMSPEDINRRWSSVKQTLDHQ